MPMAHLADLGLAENLPGIRMWLDEAALPNLPPPLELDVNGPWPAGRYDAVFTANTLHIMGWPEVQTLFAALDGVMAQDAVLAVYGPFNYGGKFTSDSNAAVRCVAEGALSRERHPRFRSGECARRVHRPAARRGPRDAREQSHAGVEARLALGLMCPPA